MNVCRGLWRIRPSQRRLRRRRRDRNSSKLLNSCQPRQPSTDVTSLRSPQHFQMFNFPLGKEGGDWRAGFHQVRTNRRADIELTKRKAIIASRGGYHYDWALFFFFLSAWAQKDFYSYTKSPLLRRHFSLCASRFSHLFSFPVCSLGLGPQRGR